MIAYFFIMKKATSGLPRTFIGKERLKFLMTIGANVAGIVITNAFRSPEARQVKYNDLDRILQEPKDDNDTIKELKGTHGCHKDLGELHTHGVLRSKSIKVKKHRLRSILRKTKGTGPLDVSPMKRRKYRNCSTNTFQHLDCTQKLKKKLSSMACQMVAFGSQHDLNDQIEIERNMHMIAF